MKFVNIPAGEFIMGSPLSEPGHRADETQHKVKFTKPFRMQTTPVTQAQWKAVMGNNPSPHLADNFPVEMVSWQDAMEFCRRITHAKEGKTYRLPTEAEWEYACRAGTTTAIGGTGNIDDMGWYLGNSNSAIHPVGQKTPNAWGLYDMHGNIWQWCSDCWGDYPSGEVTDPAGKQSDTDFWSPHVLRGGQWDFEARLCRAAIRINRGPKFRDEHIGFRVCQEIDMPASPQ